MKSKQRFLLWLFPFWGLYVQNTSQGAPMSTNATNEPQGQCEVRTTAYTCSHRGIETNATGSHLKAGDLKSAAADWSRFPLGTKFKVRETQQTYVVDDYGPALVGKNKIDLFMPSLREMRHWGVRKVTINIIERGSYAKSLALLKPRKSVPYVRRMVKVLEQKV